MSDRTHCRPVVIAEPLEGRRLLARIAVIGDLSANSGLRDVAQMVKGWNPAAIVTAGDHTHGDRSIDVTVGQYFREYVGNYNGNYGAGSTAGNRFWPTVGNHDYDRSFSEYTNFFTLPNNERYYATPAYDGLQFFIVNSNPQEADGTSSTSKQATWLKNALASSGAAWKVVMFHQPAYTSGTERNHANMQWPFQSWGADAVISGHDHMYERLSKSSFPYFVNGLAGASIVPPQRVESGSQVRYAANFGAMRIDSTATTLNFKFFSRDGVQRDDLTLAKTAAQPTPPPAAGAWQSADVGAVGNAGSTTSTGVDAMTIRGGGGDLWTSADGFRYVYQPVRGDATIVARVTGVSNTNGWAKAGVLFRDGLAANAKNVAMSVTPTNGTVMTYRTSAGAASDGSFSTGSAGTWVKLVRSGATLTGYRSSDGSNWTRVGSKTVSMASDVYVGLAVAAKNTATLNVATFSDISIAAASSAATTLAASSTTTKSSRSSATQQMFAPAA